MGTQEMGEEGTRGHQEWGQREPREGQSGGKGDTGIRDP